MSQLLKRHVSWGTVPVRRPLTVAPGTCCSPPLRLSEHTEIGFTHRQHHPLQGAGASVLNVRFLGLQPREGRPLEEGRCRCTQTPHAPPQESAPHAGKTCVIQKLSHSSILPLSTVGPFMEQPRMALGRSPPVTPGVSLMIPASAQAQVPVTSPKP